MVASDVFEPAVQPAGPPSYPLVDFPGCCSLMSNTFHFGRRISVLSRHEITTPVVSLEAHGTLTFTRRGSILWGKASRLDVMHAPIDYGRGDIASEKVDGQASIPAAVAM